MRGASKAILFFVFFFNDTATTEIYTLSLHDALPISGHVGSGPAVAGGPLVRRRRRAAVRDEALPAVHPPGTAHGPEDRKSTRLNSSHANISYAVFCLKKKNNPSY